MEQAMIPIRVSRLSDWKIYGFQWGHLRSTLEPNIVKHQSDYQILILGIVW